MCATSSDKKDNLLHVNYIKEKKESQHKFTQYISIARSQNGHIPSPYIAHATAAPADITIITTITTTEIIQDATHVCDRVPKAL